MIIHFLLHGKSLCGMKDMPAKWPEGHRWLSSDDWPNAEQMIGDGSTLCEDCKQRAPAVLAKLKEMKR